jgi:hypothetical protein
MAFVFSVQPAAAQSKIDFSAGYQYLRLVDSEVNIPGGWGASISGGNHPMVKFVVDAGGHYKDGEKLHTIQGGVEFAGKNEKTKPFVRLLTGVGIFSGDGDSTNAWAFTPEVGVKVFGSGKIGGQFAVGFPIFRAEGETEKGVRLFLGIVCK